RIMDEFFDAQPTKAPGDEPATDPAPGIGINPKRRYASASSRSVGGRSGGPRPKRAQEATE
ncbi:MAG: hypothetical protein ACRDO7_05770, partial [Nocardioidaceae bacterium]